MTTKVEIDRMKEYLRILTAEVDLLRADEAPAAGAGGLWTEYNAAYFGDKTFHVVNVDQSGAPLHDSSGATEPGQVHVSVACPPGEGYVIWGSSGEHYKLVTGPDGVEWGVCTSFEDVASGQRYPIETVLAQWINLDTGVVRDIRNVTPGKSGNVMSPQIIPSSGRYSIREWF